MWKKINYREGITKLWPQFVDFDTHSSSPFRYCNDDKGFDEERKERIATKVLKAIVESENYIDIKKKIRTQKWPNRWNVVVFKTGAAFSLNTKKMISLQIANIEVLVFIGWEGSLKVLFRV